MIATRAIELSAEGLERSAAMLRAAMPRAAHMDAGFLHWQYVANPVGLALGLEAFDGDRLVSHCVAQPLAAHLRGREVRGVMSLNAATLPEYLGRGIYFGLAKELYAMARSSGYEFGVAVTNDKSTQGFIRHCGFHLVRPLQARLGLGPLPAPRRHVAVDFEKVWSEEALAWRLSPPHVRYRYERSGEHACVLAQTGRWGIEAVLGDVPASMIPQMPRQPHETIRALRLWLGIDERIDWSFSLYRNLPLFVRPSPLNLIVAEFGDVNVGLDPQRVRWLGLDFDDF